MRADWDKVLAFSVRVLMTVGAISLLMSLAMLLTIFLFLRVNDLDWAFFSGM